MHVSWKDKSLPVRLIYTDAIRQQSDSLQQLPIVLTNGNTVYLGEVADISISRGLNSIQRRGTQRMATLTAEVDTEIITALEVTARVQQEFQQLEKQLPGYRLLFLGEKKAASDAMQGMLVAMVIALVLIFFILATLFNSLLDPLIVMFIIPFGLVGVIVGHAVFGYNLQFLSMVGFIALAGIIVNDSLILVDFIRRQRRLGKGPIDSVVEAGKVRARPIILTSVTTFLGISPLIFFATGQTAFLSPMAVSLGFGLIFATVLILIALPCFYLIADDFRGLFRARVDASVDAQAATKIIPQD
jgi:multidrug efflux pump subunit AcrB